MISRRWNQGAIVLLTTAVLIGCQGAGKSYVGKLEGLSRQELNASANGTTPPKSIFEFKADKTFTIQNGDPQSRMTLTGTYAESGKNILLLTFQNIEITGPAAALMGDLSSTIKGQSAKFDYKLDGDNLTLNVQPDSSDFAKGFASTASELVLTRVKE